MLKYASIILYFNLKLYKSCSMHCFLKEFDKLVAGIKEKQSGEECTGEMTKEAFTPQMCERMDLQQTVTVEQQKEILSNLKLEKTINVCGDGRCDSPGHSAKYGTYTLLDESTKKVIDFSLFQVSEVSSSNAMEYEGCKRSLDKILGENITVRYLTTDRHTTITAKMKTEYPEIVHQYDVWHLSKSIVKAKKKCNQELSLWIKSTSNHLWWSVATCNGDANLLREKWISIVHHAANKHRWAGCKKFKKCAHHPLSRKEKKSAQTRFTGTCSS